MPDYDITLGGAAYMVMPGGYRLAAGSPGGARVGRQRVTAADGVLASLGALPDRAGGVGPGPAAQIVAGSITSGQPALCASDGEYLFIASGTTLYRWDRAVGHAPATRATLPAAATCLTRANGLLFIGFGATADVASWNDATTTLTSSALGAGVKASMLGAHSRGVVVVGPTSPANLHIYFGSSLAYRRSWKLDARIRALASFGDGMVIATDAGLHRLSGEWYQEADPPPPDDSLRLAAWSTVAGQLQDTDDFAWLVVFHGRLVAWLGKRVVWHDTARGWWLPAGLDGAATSGAAVVNGWLMVSVTPRATPTATQLWGYDGTGWWRLAVADPGGPLGTPTADGGGKIVTIDRSTGVLAARNLDDRLTAAALVSSVTMTIHPIDAGEPEREKRWSRVGVTLGRLDGAAIGEWTIALDYSTDGGATWQSAGPATSVTTSAASVELEIDATAPAILLRATMARVSGLPPAVRNIWAEHETPGDPRRRWQLRIRARDRAINRAGQLDPRTPAQVRAALWTLWQAGGTTTFQDIDDSPARPVRIVALREETPRPSDHDAIAVFEVEMVER